MIERGIKYELRGTARIDFLPSGVEAVISIPLDGPHSPAPTDKGPSHDAAE